MSEHEKAKIWRERRGYSRQQLADLTGYSAVSIFWFERGTTPTRPGKTRYKDIAEQVWQRYKLACAAVDYQEKAARKFNW